MAMQISLDEIISMLVSRVDGLSMQSESQKNRFNIMARVLFNKGIITREDLLESMKAEHQLMVDLGALAELPPVEEMESMTDSLVYWLKGDAEAIKKSMEEYQEKLKALIREEQSKPRIDLASAEDLRRLDQMNGGSKGKLLIP